jgi:hypothetical protein
MRGGKAAPRKRSIPERQIETFVVLVEARSGDKLSS